MRVNLLCTNTWFSQVNGSIAVVAKAHNNPQAAELRTASTLAARPGARPRHIGRDSRAQQGGQGLGNVVAGAAPDFCGHGGSGGSAGGSVRAFKGVWAGWVVKCRSR
jgi:hypothetical protein